MKPDGYKFESLGLVRDGSESSAAKNIFKKGYHVTEATVLTAGNHQVSIFSEIHSSKEKNFTSINDVTFSAMERASALFGKAAFVMDRGYDDNKMFLKLDSMGQDYIIRLTAKRKLLYHNKWVFATELCNRRKGKVKLPLLYKGKMHDACNKQGNQIQRRCDKGCKTLFSQMENRRIFPHAWRFRHISP